MDENTVVSHSDDPVGVRIGENDSVGHSVRCLVSSNHETGFLPKDGSIFQSPKSQCFTVLTPSHYNDIQMRDGRHKRYPLCKTYFTVRLLPDTSTRTQEQRPCPRRRRNRRLTRWRLVTDERNSSIPRGSAVGGHSVAPFFHHLRNDEPG